MSAMPELPEVETIARTFRPRLLGRRITGFGSHWPKNVLPDVASVRAAITHRTIKSVGRRAKFIVLRLDDGAALLIHLRMSGRLAWAADFDREPPHVRAWWVLAGGDRLLFCDARKFGRIFYQPPNGDGTVTAGLGPEPLERGFTVGKLQDLLHARTRQLKPLLLDQTVIAGLGNIYTDEALFRAGLHPKAKSNRLSPAQVTRLHTAIRQVLREAIRRHGTTIDWIYPGGWMQKHLRVYGRTGEPCRTCGTPIQALRIAQRGTHICPQCQPLNGHARTRRRPKR